MFKYLMLAVYVLVNIYVMWRGALWLHHIMTRLEWNRKNPAGCLKVGNMYSFVTQGVYGPNMRTFSHAEVMDIEVHFADN